MFYNLHCAATTVILLEIFVPIGMHP